MGVQKFFLFLFLSLFAISCSSKISIKQVAEFSKVGLHDAASFDQYLNDTVKNSKEKLFELYLEDPVEFCRELNEMPVEELLALKETLEAIFHKISCTQGALGKIQNYYSSYASINSIKSAKKLESSVIVLDKSYSLPNEKQLPNKVINLTFDDGPHSENTISILNTLDYYGVKANFFMVGRNVKSSPHLVKEVALRGHSVGGHSLTHSSLDKLSFEKAKKEIIGTFDMIGGILGGVDPFFRFPYGARTKTLRNFLKENNISDFFWSVDTLDWKYKNPDFLLTYALDQTRRTGRGIVLFHDIQPQTAAILPSYLDAIEKLGYSTVVYLPQ